MLVRLQQRAYLHGIYLSNEGDILDGRLRTTRSWLISSSRSSFNSVLEEAKITPRQIEICELKFVKGMTNYQIAMQLNISDKTVEKELKTAYKQITNVIESF